MAALDVFISANEGFDPICYILANPDLASFTTQQAIEHFTNHGISEGRKQINKKLLDLKSDYRSEKFQIFSRYIKGNPGSHFPMHLGDGHFNVKNYKTESANDDFGPFVYEMAVYPDRLYLDLGCGLRRHVYLNCLYLEVYDSITADVITAPTCEYPFKDGTFDGIGCFSVLEHTRKPWLVVSEIARMLKPGGKVWIDWPFLAPLHGYPSHFFNASREGLRSIFEDNGFTIQEIGTWPHQGPDFALNWALSVLAEALPVASRERLLGMTLKEILQNPPLGEFWTHVLSEVDDDCRSTLAAGNSMVAVRNS